MPSLSLKAKLLNVHFSGRQAHRSYIGQKQLAMEATAALRWLLVLTYLLQAAADSEGKPVTLCCDYLRPLLLTVLREEHSAGDNENSAGKVSALFSASASFCFAARNAIRSVFPSQLSQQWLR